VGPEQAPQRIFPSVWLAKQFQEPLLLRRVIVPLRRRDPNLGVQRDRADGLFFQVLDTQLEQKTRDGGILENFGAFYPEIQIRHGMLLEFRSWFSSLECQSSSSCPYFAARRVKGQTASPSCLSAFHASCSSGPATAPGSRDPRCQLVRRQVRAIRVYRVPLLGVDARGFPGPRPHARTPCSCLTGLFEARIRVDATRLVALAYPGCVRGCIHLRVRLPYPYVPHLLPPFLLDLFTPLYRGRNLRLLSQRSWSAPVVPRRIALSSPRPPCRRSGPSSWFE
jgi:hypothetical protein